MDDLKYKFLDLVQQGSSRIPIIGGIPEDIPEAENKIGVEKKLVDQRLSDQELLESVDKSYYKADSFDSGLYELEKFQDLTDLNQIELKLKQLKDQQVVVSSHVLQMILEKQSLCLEEFEKVLVIQAGVNDVIANVKDARIKLGIGTSHCTTSSLGLLANYKKRTVVQQLLKYLKTINTLHKTELRVPNLLKQGEYHNAIGLLLECQSVASKYKNFGCVSALSVKLQDSLEMAEERLDVALAKICYDFEEDVYRKIQSAYLMLGKIQIAMEQLHMHYATAIQNTALNVVCSFIQGGSNDFQYSEKCKEVDENNFTPCLLTLCKSLWCICLSYYHVMNWHQKNLLTDENNFETEYNEQKIKQKLNTGLIRVWHDIQSKVSCLVMAANLENYKIDDFLKVLSILYRLSIIGEELELESDELSNSARFQSIKFFNAYHLSKLDDLKVFLEHESWTPCPVRTDFSILHLQEFRDIRYNVEKCAGIEACVKTSLDNSSVGSYFLNKYSDLSKGTPFDSNFEDDSKDEDIMTPVVDDPSGYFSEESDDEESQNKERKLKHTGPLLTNTTVTVLRLCGKYLQLSKLLKSIAGEVIMALTQLFDFYFYTVYSFFSQDTSDTICGSVSSLKLQTVIQRIKENLILVDEGAEIKMVEAQVSAIVDLYSETEIYGLKERIVAVESLLFLANEYTFLKSYLESLLQNQGSALHNLNQFYNQTVSVAVEVRKPIYAIVWNVIDVKQVLNQMAKVNWEVDVMSEHSQYVNFLIDELIKLKLKLDKLKTEIDIPEPAMIIIWENVVLLLWNIFVEGAKKCSHGGRGQMHLDFVQLESKLGKISPLKPIPNRDFVESYVKAFYLREEELEAWIKEHTEYSKKQLISLVMIACQSNKKSRQKLTALIEDLKTK